MPPVVLPPVRLLPPVLLIVPVVLLVTGAAGADRRCRSPGALAQAGDPGNLSPRARYPGPDPRVLPLRANPRDPLADVDPPDPIPDEEIRDPFSTGRRPRPAARPRPGCGRSRLERLPRSGRSPAWSALDVPGRAPACAEIAINVMNNAIIPPRPPGASRSSAWRSPGSPSAWAGGCIGAASAPMQHSGRSERRGDADDADRRSPRRRPRRARDRSRHAALALRGDRRGERRDHADRGGRMNSGPNSPRPRSRLENARAAKPE
jgi:hypothetical protein